MKICITLNKSLSLFFPTFSTNLFQCISRNEKNSQKKLLYKKVPAGNGDQRMQNKVADELINTHLNRKNTIDIVEQNLPVQLSGG